MVAQVRLELTTRSASTNRSALELLSHYKFQSVVDNRLSTERTDLLPQLMITYCGFIKGIPLTDIYKIGGCSRTRTYEDY